MKQNLYIVTLEPIEKRYTKQWYNYWMREFSKYFDVMYIDGKYEGDEIKKGRFLDINLTNIYKAQQIEKISKLFAEEKIKEDDIFLFADAWHPGVISIKYMAKLNNINVKIYGYWHAGCYDDWDFVAQAGLKPSMWGFEVSLFNALDGSFVATQFHKSLIKKSYEQYIKSNRIHVVGFPMDWELEVRIANKEKKGNIIVFPHRLDKEKQPEMFDKLAKRFKEHKFVKTLPITKTKKDYYDILSRAKISFSASLQETFGIGSVEAMFLNCIPLVPDRLSYSEMYPAMFKYNGSQQDAEIKIRYIMKHYGSEVVMSQLKRTREKVKKQSLNAIPMMAEIMKGGNK